MNNNIFFIFILLISATFNTCFAKEYYAVIKLPRHELMGKEQYIDLAKADITDKIINNIFSTEKTCPTCNSKLDKNSDNKIASSCLVNIICEYTDEISDMKILFDEKHAKKFLQNSSNNMKNNLVSSISESENVSSLSGIAPTKAHDITLKKLDEFIRAIMTLSSYKNKASLFSFRIKPYTSYLSSQEQLIEIEFKNNFLQYDIIPQASLKNTNNYYYPELKY